MAQDDKNSIEEMKANLLATMSHEMRTPMQSVFGFLELMLFENPTPKMRTMIDAAMVSASGVLEILDDILDVAKIDADKMILDQFEVPVRTLVCGVLEALEPKIVQKNIILIDDIADDVPKVIWGDPKRLRQILINLAGNAVKFTSEGSVAIKVSVAQKTPMTLRFEIIDSGIGISEEMCKTLFEPFTQADHSSSRDFGGTGLGLSISRKLVNLMNGEIGVSSHKGEGSIFWFEIPAEAVEESFSLQDLPDLVGLSILSIEDHPKAAREIVATLSSMGAVVESCRSVSDALSILKHRPFDVVIAEQGLDDGSGLDIIRYVAEHRPQAGLIMYTARDDLGLRQSLDSLGAYYLEKPASRKGLGEAVSHMAVRQQRDDSGHGNGKVLVVEDTESVRDLFSRQFELLGANVCFAQDGLEALDLLEREEFQLIVTDLHMPRMDGYGLIKKIRIDEAQTKKHMPVVLLTADIQMSGYRTYMPLGFDECLLKPVSLGSLRQLLVRWSVPVLKNDVGLSCVIQPEADSFLSLDLEVIRKQMGEISRSSCEMLIKFPEMINALVEQLLEACHQQNAVSLLEYAHSIKGAARSAGAMKLGDIAAEIQEQAEQGYCSDNLCEVLHEEFLSVQREISLLCRKYM